MFEFERDAHRARSACAELPRPVFAPSKYACFAQNSCQASSGKHGCAQLCADSAEVAAPGNTEDPATTDTHNDIHADPAATCLASRLNNAETQKLARRHAICDSEVASVVSEPTHCLCN